MCIIMKYCTAYTQHRTLNAVLLFSLTNINKWNRSAHKWNLKLGTDQMKLGTGKNAHPRIYVHQHFSTTGKSLEPQIERYFRWMMNFAHFLFFVFFFHFFFRSELLINVICCIGWALSECVNYIEKVCYVHWIHYENSLNRTITICMHFIKNNQQIDHDQRQ